MISAVSHQRQRAAYPAGCGKLFAMQIGISLPQLGPQATPENLVRCAKRAEELGYDSVWVLERLLWPLRPQEPYPATPDGGLPEQYQAVLDPIETLTFVAAHTKRVRLGTSVLVLPYHTPIQLARRIATLDVLSAGRVEVGIGTGWSRDEYAAAGTPFERRGERTDEFLRVMIDLWTKDPVGFDGSFYHIPESKVGPKPVQKPHPPIYVGGLSPKALERSVQLADGWNPVGLPSAALEPMIRQLHEMAAWARRGRLKVILRTFPFVLEESPGSERREFVGTVAEIRDDISRLRDIGVDGLLHSPPEIGFSNSPIDLGLTRMEQLMEASQ